MAWLPVALQDHFCPGDSVRVARRSRAAILLPNQTLLRLDEESTLTFPQLEKEAASWLDLLRGAVHFISRTRRSFNIRTPFVNAGIEGTEFGVRVEPTATSIWVFEGQVLASNSFGELTLTGGEAASAEKGKVPVRRLIVRPREAVQWSLYYPPLLDYQKQAISAAPDAAAIRQAVTLQQQGDLPAAFATLDAVPETARTVQFFNLRAALLLTVGRVDEAVVDIQRSLALDANNGIAYALQSVIAVTQGENDRALELAKEAAALSPRSSIPQVALTYAHQAVFDIERARQSAKRATELAPQDALAWARLAELELSLGYLDRALDAAKQAVALNPRLSHTQSVLGFAYLTRMAPDDAQATFDRAIELNPAAPLPRLGLGLADIRQGNLGAGTQGIETAAILDPDSSLIRSYLGKAYYEQKRVTLAATELRNAKQLDPRDPTPYFYSAILKQTINRPVEALRDMQKAIELNDNRAVYRSRLLLDEDLAARTANVARIYDDLGFEQRALFEGWYAVNLDPANASAHRFLADTYSALPQHEIARASELLQAQLLQSINITPVQPQQVTTNLLLLDGSGPGNASFNEFNPLFVRNRLALQAAGVAGNNDTLGDEIIVSGLRNRLSASVGQFHYETDGFRDNNDLDEDVLNAFVQVRLSPKHDVQFEAFDHDTDAGDTQHIRPQDFSPNLDRDIDRRSYRAGYHYQPTPRSDVLASFIYGDLDFDVKDTGPDPFGLGGQFDERTRTDSDAVNTEVQYLFKAGAYNLSGGAGYYEADDQFRYSTVLFLGSRSIPGVPVQNSFEITNYNAYLYTNLRYPDTFLWTLGLSADIYDDERTSSFDSNQLNPKLGLTWQLAPSTTLRLAGLRVLKPPLAVNQSIQQTQVAGFNQYFDDFNGTDSRRLGIGIDHKFTPNILGGVELSDRDLDVPTQVIRRGVQLDYFTEDRDERRHRAYLYWTATRRLALRAEYHFERTSRDLNESVVFLDDPKRIRSHRVPVGIDFFHENGAFSALTTSFVNQDVRFPFAGGGTDHASDSFWLVDASIGYRLPKRMGIASFSVRNLFDEDFDYQDTNVAGTPRLPLFQPDRSLFVKLSLSL